jgi:hypothetical protein
MTKLKRLIYSSSSILISVFALLYVSQTSFAQTNSQAQGYHSYSSMTLGTVVSTTSAGSNNLEAASLDNEKLMVGVVSNSKDSVVNLQPNGSNVTVATSGQATILVTDLNGPIRSGDNLIISPLAGVATKDNPDSSAKKYIAIASEDFDSSSTSAHQITIGKTDGGSQQVDVGTIQAKMNLLDRPPNNNTQNQNFIVAFLSKLIGKPISKVKLIAATVVMITTLLIAGILLQGSIRGSFVALGRNPLSKPLILSNLFRVIAISILILEVGFVIGYAVLVI